MITDVGAFLTGNYEELENQVSFLSRKFYNQYTPFMDLDDWQQNGWLILADAAPNYDPAKSAVQTWANSVLYHRFCNIVSDMVKESQYSAELSDADSYYDLVHDARLEQAESIRRLLPLLSPSAKYVLCRRLVDFTYEQILIESGWQDFELARAVLELRNTSGMILAE